MTEQTLDGEKAKKRAESSKARYKATQDLIANHQDEFEQLVAKHGGTTRNMKQQQKIKQLREELQNLTGQQVFLEEEVET